jgi:hypothetical protein
MYRSTFFFTSALVGGESSASLPCHVTPGKELRYPFYRRLGGPQSRSGRYGEVKIFYPIGTRTPALPGRPAHSQSLYRLSHPGSLWFLWWEQKCSLKRQLFFANFHGCSPNYGRIYASIQNKKSRTVENGWSSSLNVGRGANNSL